MNNILKFLLQTIKYEFKFNKIRFAVSRLCHEIVKYQAHALFNIILAALKWLEKETNVPIRRKYCINGFIGLMEIAGSNIYADWVKANGINVGSSPILLMQKTPKLFVLRL